jgi:hypothetical protein
MPESDSPRLWDHTGHPIRSQPEGEYRGTVPGNAWCYRCNVPVAADWTVDLGLKPIQE